MERRIDIEVIEMICSLDGFESQPGLRTKGGSGRTYCQNMRAFVDLANLTGQARRGEAASDLTRLASH